MNDKTIFPSSILIRRVFYNFPDSYSFPYDYLFFPSSSNLYRLHKNNFRHIYNF
jgi:hypothetical protein